MGGLKAVRSLVLGSLRKPRRPNVKLKKCVLLSYELEYFYNLKLIFLCPIFRISQVELSRHLEGLAEELRKISETPPVPVDLDDYTKRLTETRQRVIVVQNILQTVQVRYIHYSFSLCTPPNNMLNTRKN